jgi:hypothetical protein
MIIRYIWDINIIRWQENYGGKGKGNPLIMRYILQCENTGL